MKIIIAILSLLFVLTIAAPQPRLIPISNPEERKESLASEGTFVEPKDGPLAEAKSQPAPEQEKIVDGQEKPTEGQERHGQEKPMEGQEKLSPRKLMNEKQRDQNDDGKVLEIHVLQDPQER